MAANQAQHQQQQQSVDAAVSHAQGTAGDALMPGGETLMMLAKSAFTSTGVPASVSQLQSPSSKGGMHEIYIQMRCLVAHSLLTSSICQPCAFLPSMFVPESGVAKWVHAMSSVQPTMSYTVIDTHHLRRMGLVPVQLQQATTQASQVKQQQQQEEVMVVVPPVSQDPPTPQVAAAS
jgi:hypothetical protein